MKAILLIAACLLVFGQASGANPPMFTPKTPAKRFVFATGNAYYNCMDGRFYPVFRSKFGGWDFYMRYDRAKGKRVRQYLNPWI